MGVDITIYLEGKSWGDGEEEPEGWELIEEVWASRWYDGFNRIAGVRSSPDEWEVCPRGLPNDLSEELADIWDQAKDWAHTPSWSEGSELFIIGAWCHDSIDITEIIKYRRIRAVFWFDS